MDRKMPTGMVTCKSASLVFCGPIEILNMTTMTGRTSLFVFLKEPTGIY